MAIINCKKKCKKEHGLLLHLLLFYKNTSIPLIIVNQFRLMKVKPKVFLLVVKTSNIARSFQGLIRPNFIP